VCCIQGPQSQEEQDGELDGLGLFVIVRGCKFAIDGLSGGEESSFHCTCGHSDNLSLDYQHHTVLPIDFGSFTLGINNFEICTQAKKVLQEVFISLECRMVTSRFLFLQRY
jgi:hypothetical protein